MSGFGERLARRIKSAPGVEAWREWARERTRPARWKGAPHEHLEASLQWLCRAQDATRDGGFARGYSLVFIPHLGMKGWQPSYPETTGYIIPTILEASLRFEDGSLRERAMRAALWELDVQMSNGAIPGGVITDVPRPAAFNTGQVMLGWLAAYQESSDARFADACRRAADFLVATQDELGWWPPHTVPYAHAEATAYNTRTAWALAEVGRQLDRPAYVDTAVRKLRAIAGSQRPNGWLPNCCLSDPERPLLHTIAYAIRGFVESGSLLEDDRMVRAGEVAARALAEHVGTDGRMAGRFGSDWRAAVRWSCLTGQAQMTNIWIRLASVTGSNAWLEPAEKVLRFLMRVHDVSSEDPGLLGGVRGSWPIKGHYGRWEVLNWATKFFCDALMRWQDVREGSRREGGPLRLA